MADSDVRNRQMSYFHISTANYLIFMLLSFSIILEQCTQRIRVPEIDSEVNKSNDHGINHATEVVNITGL